MNKIRMRTFVRFIFFFIDISMALNNDPNSVPKEELTKSELEEENLILEIESKT